MSDTAELGSIASTLDQLIERVDAIATGYDGTPREDVGMALLEVERSLTAGARRLERLLRDLG